MTEHASSSASEAVPNIQARGRLRVSRRTLAIGVGLVLAIVLFLFGGDSWLSVLDVTLIAALATLSLNVLSGYTGQVSLGIAFFMGVGAYTACWLGGSAPISPGDPAGLNLPVVLWLPAAGVAAGLVGMLIGPTALRLKGFYLGIVTLALIFIGQYVFKNLRSISGGPQGRAVPQPAFGDFTFNSQPTVLGLTLTGNQCFFVFLLGVLVVVALVVGNVARTRAGRAWQAVRDNEVGASIIGVNLFRTKMGAFVFSSFLAGIAGALWASYFGYATPDLWSLALSIQFIAAMLIGGAATIWGSILGAAFVFAVPTALQQFSLVPQNASNGGGLAANAPTIAYGVLIIVFMVFEPAGLVGLARRIQMRAQRATAGRRGGASLTNATLAPPTTQSPVDIEMTQLP